MTAFIPYVQMILLSGLGYLFYYSVLRRRPDAGFNRIFLFAGILLSLMVFIPRGHSPGTGILVYELPEIVVGSEIIRQPLNIMSYMHMFWLIPTIFFLGLFIIRLVRIAQLANRSEKRQFAGTIIRVPDQDHTAFSFFNHIFISEDLLNSSDVRVIISHERSHVRHFHTADVIFMEVLCMFFWFNPFFWLIRKEFAEVHELQADMDVVKKGIPVASYQEQLLRYAMQASSHTFVPAFSKLLVKKRIKVLNQIKNQRRNVMKYILSLPVVFILLQLSFQPVSFASPDNSASVTVMQEEVDTPPQYKEGQEAMMKKLAAEIKYPKSAQKAGIQGTVYIKFTITKDGKMIKAEIQKGFNDACDSEALRVVRTLTEWIPATKDGKNVEAEMTIPIKFNLK